MAALGVGGFGLLTSPTSALGRVTPHQRLVRRLAPDSFCYVLFQFTFTIVYRLLDV